MKIDRRAVGWALLVIAGPALGGSPAIQPPAQPPNLVRLSAAEQLGKDIYFDSTLSNPRGYSCATCHAPATGYSAISSEVNVRSGVMPGVVAGRSGSRKPQSVAYSAFSPVGPQYVADLGVWLGGNFWDGRARDNAEQARFPLIGPNEMANTPVGPYPPHEGGFAPMVAAKLRARPYAGLFPGVFGPSVLMASDAEVEDLATRAVAAFEASAEVSSFSSKYDASPSGVPARTLACLSATEENGRAIFFGKAQCSACHSSATIDLVSGPTGGRDTFTMFCYANIGVPKNPNNPFYRQTDARANPFGFNPLGGHYVDLGLGQNPNPAPDGTRFFDNKPGDIPDYRGLFKAPTVRNVDRRPGAYFVKAYMHNGAFKTLEEVVHFYNKRNIAVDRHGNEASFDLRVGPPLGYTPLFAPPEVIDNVQNVAGATPDAATSDVASNGQVGALGLTSTEEADLVHFLKALTDGYTRPNP